MLICTLFMVVVVETVMVVVEVEMMMERQGGSDGDDGSDGAHDGDGASLQLRAKGDTNPNAQVPHYVTSLSAPPRRSPCLWA